MDLEKTIKQEVEKEVMQAINDLAIKSVIREKIVEAGISKDDVRDLIKECADSYVRSCDIGVLVKRTVDNLVKSEIEKNIKEMFELRTFEYRTNQILKDEMGKQVVKAFFDNYTLSVDVKEN